MPKTTLSRGLLRAVLAVLPWAALAPALATTLVEHRELPQLVEESSRGVLVEVAGVEYGRDDRGLPCTTVTLDVLDALYGPTLPPVGGRFKIKLFGAPVALSGGARIFVDGTPLYAIGDRYLLLLIGESEWGFTNTAGLSGGAFRVFADGAVHGPAVGRGVPDRYPRLRETVSELWIRSGGRLLEPRESAP